LFHIEKPVAVNNLNEEEPQEQGKKTQSDEIIFNAIPGALALTALSRTSPLADYYQWGHPNHNLEIFLPPPKWTS
jgi:hypothetical protein